MSVRAIRNFLNSSPLARGMIAYGTTYPTAVLIQERYISKNEELPVERMIEFGVFASFYVAPSIYCWQRLAKHLFPTLTFNNALKLVLVENVSYRPFSITSFYIVTSLLEGKSLQDGYSEFRQKFWATYKIAAFVWPCAQIVNYTLVAPKNRILYMSMCSLAWGTFLAFMKSKDG